MKGSGTSPEAQLDREDMAGLASGDQRALERLYDRYAQRLTGFFWRLGRRQPEIEELVHETFVRLWRYGRGWRGEARFTTYLFGIARSAWLDSRQKGNRGSSAGDLNLRPAPVRPEVEAERRELGREIEKAVAELAEPLRLVFSMSTAAGLKYREIAEVLEIPLGTVKSRMAAAEEKLRISLSKYLKQDAELD